jgi:hypothetical protein
MLPEILKTTSCSAPGRASARLLRLKYRLA